MRDAKLFLPQFAAQAVLEFELYAKRLKGSGSRRASMLSTFAELIRGAVHIVLPNRGEIYRDNKGDATVPTQDECDSFLGMPAPVCCFEYPWAYDYTPNKDLADYGMSELDATKRITLAIDGKQIGQSSVFGDFVEDRVVLFSFSYMPSFRMWAPHEGVVSIKSPLEVWQGSKPNEWGIICGLYQIETMTQCSPGDPKTKLWFSQMMPDIVAVVQCCHALRAGAAFREVTEPHASRRWKFDRKGCGGFVYHVLEIPSRSASGACGDHAGSHASPRRHIRRAHIRKLPSGALTFVRQCFVGELSYGAVDKHYQMRASK